MRLLLDTHVLLWWLADDPQLSAEARDAIADPENAVVVSAVSVWEVTIKKALGKLEIADQWYAVLSEEPFQHLSISWEHARRIEDLPDLHRDPFDRLLVAQAIEEGLVLVTHDEEILRYDVSALKT